LYQNAAAQLARIASVFDCPAALEMDSFTLGRRPIPAGGMPFVGRSLHPDGGIFDGLYTVVMHSGFSNGAGVAQAALEDILSGTRTSEIAPFGMVAS
jgi:glycine/D-amino acid oxidase-like deaminating enzyme